MIFQKKRSIKNLLPPPVKAEHGEYSMIFSACDNPAELTPELLNLSLKAIQEAASVDLREIAQRNDQARRYANIWPGEHYRLLAGLALALRPSIVIEIGTSTGLSALCMKKALGGRGNLTTFDVMPWHLYENTLLQQTDFEDKSLVQHVCDLSDEASMRNHAALLEEAELIFIDATHDGRLEKKLLDNLGKIAFKKPCFVLFDDIKVWTMLKMWREIPYPKIDLTSFGHWSGTGLVQLPFRHRNNLKNRNFDQEAPQNFCPERATIADRQGASEDKNSGGKPTQSKTDSSGCFGANKAFTKRD